MRSPFKYECTVCGKCCLWGGWVCLYVDDVTRISKELNVSIQEFVDKYTKHIAVEYSSKDETLLLPYLALKMENDSCVFIKDGLCSIHDFKPIHCKASPLLAEFLLDDEGWEKFKTECPGFGKGEIVTRPEIDKALMEQAERDMAYEDLLEENDWDLGKILGVTLPEPEIIRDLGIEIELEE